MPPSPALGNQESSLAAQNQTVTRHAVRQSFPAPRLTDDVITLDVSNAMHYYKLVMPIIKFMTLSFPHPGRLLRTEFLEPMGITAYRLAKEIGVPLTRITAILACQRAITADTGLRLDRYFSLSEGYWYGLQQDYDLRQAKRQLRAALSQIQPYVPAAA